MICQHCGSELTKYPMKPIWAGRIAYERFICPKCKLEVMGNPLPIRECTKCNKLRMVRLEEATEESPNEHWCCVACGMNVYELVREPEEKTGGQQHPLPGPGFVKTYSDHCCEWCGGWEDVQWRNGIGGYVCDGCMLELPKSERGNGPEPSPI